MAGIYIHIPFCKSRCAYCGFYSTTDLGEAMMTRYAEAVENELAMRRGYLGGETVETVYLGGGTPSQLPDEALRRIIESAKAFAKSAKEGDGKSDSTDEGSAGSASTETDLATSASTETDSALYREFGIKELTVECNPDDMTEGRIGLLAELGVNRVSMGVQTFSPEYLRFLGRRHDNNEVRQAVEWLRQAGIGNISLDLMYGFPKQTIEDLDHDIDCLLALNPTHISTYCLTYEEDTPLWKKLERGDIEELSEETEEKMYFRIAERLKAAGYEHYELSNFARPGFRAKHNSSYWNGTKYLGVGAAAHSYNGESREWNVSDIKKYISSIGYFAVEEREVLSLTDRYNDLIVTAMRTSDGISPIYINKVFGQELASHFETVAKKLAEQDLVEFFNDRVRIAPSALFVSDRVMRELVATE